MKSKLKKKKKPTSREAFLDQDHDTTIALWKQQKEDRQNLSKRIKQTTKKKEAPPEEEFERTVLKKRKRLLLKNEREAWKRRMEC